MGVDMKLQASNEWKSVSGDITTAFLSGEEEPHNIFVHPSDDVRDISRLSPGSMLRLHNAVYGLVNGRTKWWDRLKRSLQNHGFTSCALDPCAFVLKQNRVRGVTGVPVDDLLR